MPTPANASATYKAQISAISGQTYNVTHHGVTAGGSAATNTTALNTILSSVTHGDVIYFPAGTYAVGATSWTGFSLSSLNNVTICGDGEGSLIDYQVEPSQTTGVSSNPVGFLFTSMTGLNIKDLAFTTSNTTDAVFIELSSCTDCVLSNLVCTSCAGLASIFAIGGSRNRYTLLQATGGATAGFKIGHTNSGKIESYATVNQCVASGTTTDGFVFVTAYSSITNCIAYDNAHSGLILSSATDIAHDTVISGCVARNNTYSGIQFDPFGSAYIYNCSISNNICCENDVSGIYHVGGYNNVISGNICYDNDNDTTGSGYGIHITGYSVGVNVTGNRCYDTRTSTSRTQESGIRVQATTAGVDGIQNISLVGNSCDNNLNHGFHITNPDSSNTIRDINLTGNSATDNGGSGFNLSDSAAGYITEVTYIGNASYDNTSADIVDMGVRSGIKTATTSQLANVAHGINTNNKISGMMVYNTTTSTYVWASGSAAADEWYSIEGLATDTPTHSPA